MISAMEESRLGSEAVLAALGPDSQARCIADLGGGSLEISVLRDHTVLQTAQLPVGTVRLMTTLNLPGEIRPVQAEQVRRYVRALLESKLASRPNLADRLPSRWAGTRKLWPMSHPVRGITACQRWNFRCSASACRNCCVWTIAIG